MVLREHEANPLLRAMEDRLRIYEAELRARGLTEVEIERLLDPVRSFCMDMVDLES